MTSIASTLSAAAKGFGQCAKAVESRATNGALTTAEYERRIGFGMACDWIGWARTLHEISYTERRRQESDRAYALNELTRFTYLWTATNALFARDEVLRVLDPNCAATTELDRFRVLFNICSFSAAEISGRERNLHALLSLPMYVKSFPWPALNNPPTILEVIYFKYTVPHEQKRGLGKKLLAAAKTNNYHALDLPTLIYATRNWNVHGVLLSSSFRGTRKKFNLWIDTVNSSLAEVLERSSREFLSRL